MLALQVLYQADVTGRDPTEVLAELREDAGEVPEFARQLVEGVAQRLQELDALIGAYAEGWSVPRLVALDRSILRLACFELLRGEVPAAIAISEAVGAARELSTEDSGRFVNGILGRIARDAPEVEGRAGRP